jgi:hypothetical protein
MGSKIRDREERSSSRELGEVGICCGEGERGKADLLVKVSFVVVGE